MLEADVRLQRGDFALNARLRWPGGLLGVTGPSGCGKTTLLHTLAGLTRPDVGRIALNGRTLFDAARGVWTPPHRRRVAVAFQDDRLQPHRSVRGNLLFGYRRTPRDRRRLHPEQVTAWLELDGLLHRRVARLSGGEKRRVGVGRALLTSPDLLLLDEPTNGLDARMCDRVLDLIGRSIALAQTPTLMVSHHIEHLLRLTDRLLVMQAGEVLTQRQASSALCVNRLPLTVRAHRAASGLTEMTLRGAQGTPAPVLRGVFSPGLAERSPAVGLLPADQIVLAMAPVETVSMQNRLPGRVVELIHRDESVICVVDAGVRLRARITRQARDEFDIRPGARVWCLFKAPALRVYPDFHADDGADVASDLQPFFTRSPSPAVKTGDGVNPVRGSVAVGRRAIVPRLEPASE